MRSSLPVRPLVLVPLLAALACAPGCAASDATVGVARGPSSPVRAELPAPASEGLVIPARGDDAWTLERLLEEYGRVTGQALVWSADSASGIERTRVQPTAPVRVPAERVHEVVQALLREHDVFVARVLTGEPRLAVVASLQTSARQSARAKAVYVPVADLPLWAGHPARLVQTTVTLPSTDVRTLSNSMRTMLTDPNTQQIIPVGTSSTVILTGFVPRVLQLVELLREIDAQASGGTAAVDGTAVDPTAVERTAVERNVARPGEALGVRNARATRDARPTVPLLPAATAELVVPPAGPEGWSLARLLEEYGRLTGQSLVWERDEDATLRRAPVGNASELRVPPERVHEVVETLLVEHGFLFTGGVHDEAAELHVEALARFFEARGSTTVRFVDSSELEAWRAHPARLVQTAVPLQALDARSTATSLRSAGDHAQMVLPAGEEQAVVLCGPGPWVATQAATLREADAAAQAAASGGADGAGER